MTKDGFGVRIMYKLFSSHLGMNCSFLVREAARLSTSCSQAPEAMSQRREPRLPTNHTNLVFVSPCSLPPQGNEDSSAEHDQSSSSSSRCVPHTSIFLLFHLRVHYPLPRPVNPIPSPTSTFGNGFPSAVGAGRKPTRTR